MTVIGRFVARPTPTHYRWTPLMFVDVNNARSAITKDVGDAEVHREHTDRSTSAVTNNEDSHFRRQCTLDVGTYLLPVY